MTWTVLLVWISGTAVARPGAPGPTCVVEEIVYRAKDGAVLGCEDGGTWCSGAPSMPGICSRPPNDTGPSPEIEGRWGHAYGVCRGNDFVIHADRVEYLSGLEPLGTGRILRVDSYLGGVTIQTILAGDGRFLSLWPSEDAHLVFFGVGKSIEKSRKQRCLVQRGGPPS